MLDKYEMLDQIIVNVNALLDARGVDKCRLGVDVIQRLAALKAGLMEDDKRMEGEKHAETDPG